MCQHLRLGNKANASLQKAAMQPIMGSYILCRAESWPSQICMQKWSFEGRPSEALLLFVQNNHAVNP